MRQATVHLTCSLEGGAKKRKKKVYTKPKKIPHKHKKVKLAVLKFYKVDGQDRVRGLAWAFQDAFQPRCLRLCGDATEICGANVLPASCILPSH